MSDEVVLSGPFTDEIEISRVSWKASRELSYAQWVAQGRTIGQIQEASLWWLGDWWNYGERYGDRVAIVKAEGFPWAPHTCRVAGYVASRFGVFRRRNTLSWSHHSEIAQFDSITQDDWLDKAEAEGWSQKELRKQVRSPAELEQADEEEAGDDEVIWGGSLEGICPTCGGSGRVQIEEVDDADE